MTRKSSLSSLLYKAARISRDINAVEHPEKIPKRIENKLTGRYIVSKLWRR